MDVDCALLSRVAILDRFSDKEACLTLCPWEIFPAFLPSADFKINLMLGLIWVQTVCKSYQ